MNMTQHQPSQQATGKFVPRSLTFLRYLTMHWINPVCESYEIDFI